MRHTAKKVTKKVTTLTSSWIQNGGAILGIGALASKFLSLIRDRIFLEKFPAEGTTDLLFAAFRIPDFFFFLLISGTIATILIPRLADQKDTDHQTFISSMASLVFLGFGSICFLAAALAPGLTEIIAGGFSGPEKIEITQLSRILFAAVFMLSLSSVFGAALQYYRTLWPLAITPLIYTIGIITGTFIWSESFGILAVGYGAIAGASMHLIIQAGVYTYKHGLLKITWHKPVYAWKGVKRDFVLRVLNSSTFQINQSIDILIGSFLLAGSVTAFTLGSALGHVLLTIIGISTARAIFPKLSDQRKTPLKQKETLAHSHQFIWMISIPASIIMFLAAGPIIQILYGTQGDLFRWTVSIFQWTVASLPFACLIPIYSRVFLAHNDTKTPLYLTTIAFIIATGTAAILSLLVLPESNAVIGLGIGNFLANTILFTLLWIVSHRRYFNV